MVLVLIAVVVALVFALVYVRKQLEVERRTLVSVRRSVDSDESGAALIRTIRERVHGEEDALATLEDFRLALDTSPTGVVLIDEFGRVEYANRAARGHIDETGDWAILRTRVASLAKQAAAAGEVQRVEVDMHDPARVVLLLTAHPFAPVGDRPAAVTVYVEDLSARRRVDAMRSDFVANASHELKTPIGALSLLAESLAYTDDDEKRAAIAERVVAEAARMTNVIDDILTLARTESVTHEYQPVDIAGVLDEVVAVLGSLAANHDVTLERGDVDHAMVLGDRVELVSAFRNLVLNAITYTHVKGDPGTVSYRTRIEEGNVCIEVEDTGIGIPSKYLRRIFERFFRVDQARSRQSGGTGLGLSIVKNVAVAHGGRVYAESQVGVGTTFTMCLPVPDESPR